MKRLITCEEHYNSELITEHLFRMYKEAGEEPDQQVARGAAGDPAPGVRDLGAERIAYMDAVGVDTQIISYAAGVPATLEPKFSIPLCRKVNDEMAEKCRKYPGRFSPQAS